MAREAAERTGKQVGILGDLPGPKLRIGDVEDGIVGLRPGIGDRAHHRGLRRHATSGSRSPTTACPRR